MRKPGNIIHAGNQKANGQIVGTGGSYGVHYHSCRTAPAYPGGVVSYSVHGEYPSFGQPDHSCDRRSLDPVDDRDTSGILHPVRDRPADWINAAIYSTACVLDLHNDLNYCVGVYDWISSA